MKKPIFTGSGVAIATPFTKDGVDFDTLGKLLDFQLEGGTDAIVACGTTGEAAVGEGIDALTGATVTSKAVTRAVNSAAAFVTGADVSSGATEWEG